MKIAKAFGAADELDETDSPNTIRQIGMTPAQQSTAAHQASTAEQTKKHQDAIERQGNERLALERQRAQNNSNWSDPTYQRD